MHKLKVRKAVIPAAGLGTRFLPATKALPKEMLPYCRYSNCSIYRRRSSREWNRRNFNYY